MLAAAPRHDKLAANDLAFVPANDSTHCFFVFDAEAEQWDHRTSF
jgi:hypothetical protein